MTVQLIKFYPQNRHSCTVQLMLQFYDRGYKFHITIKSR